MQSIENRVEIWKSIPGWEGRYEASSFGRVRSLPRLVIEKGGRRVNLPGKIMTRKPGPHGYILLSLCKDGKKYPEYAHRLVGSAFHGTPAPDQVIRHLDGVGTNNRPDNLAWGTHWENMQDKFVHGTNRRTKKSHCKRGHSLVEPNIPARGARHCRACKRANQVVRYSGNREKLQEISDRKYREIMGSAGSEGKETP